MRGKPPALLCDFTRFYPLVNVRGSPGCDADVSVHKKSTALLVDTPNSVKHDWWAQSLLRAFGCKQPQVSLNVTHTHTHRSGEVTCTVFSRSSVSVSASCWPLFCRVRFVKPADSPNIIRHKAQRRFLAGFWIVNLNGCSRALTAWQFKES